MTQKEIEEHIRLITQLCKESEHAVPCEAFIHDIMYFIKREKLAVLDFVNKDVIGEDEKGEQAQIPCPDFKSGCAVYHVAFKMTSDVNQRNKIRIKQRTKLKALLEGLE